ncbi:DUF2924 domain-containing protein [Parasphingorhabdus cellanae]|uniref:DUF2924 domain-containing protein n=1 Tax=Parasphingorhabdus cellanae TaxID=2806553 RepID=A0ABX7T8S6_9SPHN|nr:DUF2924 domain-containing protein [Parasphingorhabdus cellanae]QTD56912.1 DUF2924 domain-containing protein [Parasphingorhabdus cellanae]
MTKPDKRLADLIVMPPAQLRSAWRDTFKSPAPDIGPDLLRRGIANRLQERMHGSLTGATKREIERLRKRVERTGKASHMHAISLKTGTRLVRSWNGKSYHVLVCDNGFEFEGRQYSSLSHIARAITGAHWSGPRFFGLKKRSGYGPKVLTNG